MAKASAAVSERIATSTEPIRNTVAYKAFADTIVDALDDSGSAKHAGFEEKEERRRRRQARLAKAGVGSMGKGKARVQADPEFVPLSLLFLSDGLISYVGQGRHL